ncbi:hypothetical protein PSEUBRA_002721 [Kalmanozyma brasiliensis GHG001]|uniref:Uncharacterized protein n=1 Tax=Kalmanozyma brasiliensis (strain GHG001) TaxID=1365824 RepID=V5EB66_KALBG|nr:uncharacterized protein PSEUBRA_002721 [Kalmanozyma brasiliensis GHG001]EST07631.1 hypothetical protein PSEUBRA_002721 [Kalmanozyma brasiliensis GHG001]
MNASKADQEVKQVVRDLLCRDPVMFNSVINSHFASASTYQGRGLKITGASQLKHAAYLLNALNFGSAAKIEDRDVHWDAASSTAVVQATRFIRPAFFPLFEFAVPTKLVLTFNAEEGEKQTLYCTQWKDEWPLDQLIQSIPIVGKLYSSLLVPLFTAIFLVLSNVAFWFHAKLETVEHRYGHHALQAYRHKVQPRLPSSLVKGFDTGVHAAEHASQRSVHIVSRVSHGPLRAVEELARTATVVFNLALPQQLQLPYPSVFAESAQADKGKSSNKASETRSAAKEHSEKPTQDKPASPKPQSAAKPDEAGPKSPKEKVSGAQGTADDKKGEQKHEQPSTEKTENDKPAPTADDAAENRKRKAESAPAEPVPHAKVVVGPAEDGSAPAQAKEFDILTQQVTEKAPTTETEKPSLYQALKKDDQLVLPTGEAASSGGAKKSSHKKKGKNGGRK